MISCTDFIPAYNALFQFLARKYGQDAVSRYWTYLFDYTKSSLYTILCKEGLQGCYTYWSGTLSEEAADFTLYLDQTQGYFLLDMHHCPSKGRLLKLQQEEGIAPYPDYCLHCDCYRTAVEACGLKYLFNCVDSDKAACSILIYDPAVFRGQVMIGPETRKLHRSASDNVYFHQAFHNSLNKGITYLAETYGAAAVSQYLTEYAREVYHSVAEDARQRGLVAIQEKILRIYESEQSPDAVVTNLADGILTVSVAYGPAERYLRNTGREISPHYALTTEVVMKTLAEMIGLTFHMDFYDPETGKASYRFAK